MSYIVKNCPNCNHTDWDNGYGELEEGYLCDVQIDDFECKDCNCLIKQVIDACKREAVINYPKKEKEFITVNGYQAILNMFDIEEINK